MDIQHLVDRLEDLIDEGRHIPMTKLTLIDEERALEIIDQMRISVPEEVDKATRILNQKDRLLAQANEEASRIIDLAKEKAEHLIQRDAIVQAAQNRAANIIEQARQDADAIRVDADTYVAEVLNELEGQLMKTLTVVRNGINKIQQDRDTSRVRAEAAPTAMLAAKDDAGPVAPAAFAPAAPVASAALKPAEARPSDGKLSDSKLTDGKLDRHTDKSDIPAEKRVDVTLDL
jgi:F0F1-type ATP synthase membrane subunit b/b'